MKKYLVKYTCCAFGQWSEHEKILSYRDLQDIIKSNVHAVREVKEIKEDDTCTK